MTSFSQENESKIYELINLGSNEEFEEFLEKNRLERIIKRIQHKLNNKVFKRGMVYLPRLLEEFENNLDLIQIGKDPWANKE